jgi:hypothetical protein
VSHAEGKKRPPTFAVRNLAGLGVSKPLHREEKEKRLQGNTIEVFVAHAFPVCPYFVALVVTYSCSGALEHRERR